MAQIYASADPFSTNDTAVQDIRKSKTYHPSVWKDHFLSYTSTVTEVSVAEKEQLDKLKEKVKYLLAQTPDISMLKIELIDVIQRLGFAYHFQHEIHESLQTIHDTYISNDDDDLRVVALRFRLHRNHGYRVSCDVFKKFTDEEENFKVSLIEDIEGMFNLYEASFYSTNGEEILDKARQFSTSHLESLINQTNNTSLSRRVREALEFPISRTLNRMEAKRFISLYQEDESHNKDLLNFAKLDFNILQKKHQREANQITRWWENLDFANKLPFARDRAVECYFWSLGIQFEPHYDAARIFLAKVLALITIIDDFYDVYGTLDELRRFTHAVDMWDISAGDELPPYMKICYEALIGAYAEMEKEMGKQGQSYRIRYAIQVMKEIVNAYMEEAEWCYNNYIPSIDEYLKVALVSAGDRMLATSSLVGLGDVVTKHDLDWITNKPPILRASEVIPRLMNDLVGHKKEQKITIISCYMNEHGCSEMEACSEVLKQVKKGWKDFNEECMKLWEASMEMEIIARLVNMGHVIHILYNSDEDEYTNSSARTKEAIKLVLVDRID